MSKNLIFFDDGLKGDSVNRRWSGEEGKCREDWGSYECDKRLDERYDGSHMERDGWNCDLHGTVRGEAESAVRVREIPARVNVDSLNRAEGQDQSNADNGEQQPPWTQHSRF